MLQACLNTGNSVAQLGFFGPTGRRLWCRTHTEGLHLWDWMSACSEEGAEGTGALLAMENFREVSGQAAAAAGIAELANNVRQLNVYKRQVIRFRICKAGDPWLYVSP